MRLDPTDRRPVFRQVADLLRQAITSGTYAPGDRLPPGRELARDFGVAPNTIAAAQNLLREEGLLTSQQGRGFFVLEPGPRSAATLASPQRIAELDAEVSDLRRQIGMLREQVTDIYSRIGVSAPGEDNKPARPGRRIP